MDIEIHSVAKKKNKSKISYYELIYTNPDEGNNHIHAVPVQAIATRSELLGLSREEAIELIISEAHMPQEDVDVMYEEALESKYESLHRTVEEKQAQRVPLSHRLDAEMAVFQKSGDSRAHQLRKARHVLPGPGWDRLVAQIQEDREEIDLEAAYYLTDYMMKVEPEK